MNTREGIIGLLIESRETLTAGDIAIKLNKTTADIRKILSNLSREGKIERLAYGKYSSVNVSKSKELTRSNESVNVISNQSVNVVNGSVNVKELIKKAKQQYYAEHREVRNAYYRKYYAEHREQIREYQKKYFKKWRAKHPDYNKLWLREFRKKYPGKQKEYDARYWLKKAMELREVR